MAKKGRTYTPSELDAKMRGDHAAMCGVLSRACGVLGIPWKHDDDLAIYESQIKALDKWLTQKQFYDPLDKLDESKSKNVIDDVEVPFG